MKLSDLKPGMTVYDCHSYKMGNTSMRSIGVWTVRIIDVTEKYALVRWNGNDPEKYYERHVRKLMREKPVLIRNVFGACRKETREERRVRLANVKVHRAGP